MEKDITLTDWEERYPDVAKLHDDLKIKEADDPEPPTRKTGLQQLKDVAVQQALNIAIGIILIILSPYVLAMVP